MGVGTAKSPFVHTCNYVKYYFQVSRVILVTMFSLFACDYDLQTKKNVYVKTCIMKCYGRIALRNYLTPNKCRSIKCRKNTLSVDAYMRHEASMRHQPFIRTPLVWWIVSTMPLISIVHHGAQLILVQVMACRPYDTFMYSATNVLMNTRASVKKDVVFINGN